MESPWRRNFCIFIIFYYNVAASSQNVPAGLHPSPLQLGNLELINTVGSPQLLRRSLFLNGPDGSHDIPYGADLQEIQNGIGPPFAPRLVQPQMFQPLPQGPMSLNPYSLQGSASILPGIPQPPIVPELPAVKCPPLALVNQVKPIQQRQIPIENVPTPEFSNACLSSYLQQNFNPTASVISLPPQSVPQIDIPSVPSLPSTCPPLSSLSLPPPIPINIPPGTATILPTIPPQYSIPNNNLMTVFSDVNLAQSGYQVTVLPSVPNVQATSESVVYPNSYSSPQIFFGTENFGQVPVTPIALPEEPPLPPPPFPPNYGMPPIIVSKSGSSWKKWLPSLLVTLLSNRRGKGGECCCSPSSGFSDNMYIPFPIPVPTNNPIIVDGSSNDDADEGDLEYEDY